MTDYALIGCPACNKLMVNGKQRYSCRIDYKDCSNFKKCKFKTRVFDVLNYLSTAENLDGVQETIKDVVDLLREGR